MTEISRLLIIFLYKYIFNFNLLRKKSGEILSMFILIMYVYKHWTDTKIMFTSSIRTYFELCIC